VVLVLDRCHSGAFPAFLHGLSDSGDGPSGVGMATDHGVSAGMRAWV